MENVYFHVCALMRRVLPRAYCHNTCTLHDTSKHGPRKHVTGMHCSIAVVLHKIMCVKMKLRLSSIVHTDYVSYNDYRRFYAFMCINIINNLYIHIQMHMVHSYVHICIYVVRCTSVMYYFIWAEESMNTAEMFQRKVIHITGA